MLNVCNMGVYSCISNLFLKDLFGRKIVCLFDKKVIVYCLSYYVR